MISTSGTEKSDFTLLAEINDESYTWSSHYIDLANYAGKDVRIAFVHTSVDKFLLAVDNIFAGEPTAPTISSKNDGLHYFAKDDDAEISLKIYNSGATANITKIKITPTDDTYSTIETPFDIQLNPGCVATVTVPLNLEVGDAFKYTATAVMNDDTEIELFTDFVNKSYFKKTMIIEKYTGTWCNSCPVVTLPVNLTKERMKDEAAVLEVHFIGTGYDSFECTEYVQPIPYKLAANLPTLYYDRTFQHNYIKQFDTTGFDSASLAPCIASVDYTIDNVSDNGVTVTAKVQFAEDIDNSNDKYRIGYTISKNEVRMAEDSNPQISNITGSSVYYGEFHYTSGVIAKDLYFMDDLVCGTSVGAIGMTGSLPAEIKGGEIYSHTFTYPLDSDQINSLNDYRMLITVVNATDDLYKIMNGTVAETPSTDNPVGGVKETSVTNKIELYTSPDGQIIKFAENAPLSVEIFNLNGELINRAAYEGDEYNISGRNTDYNGVAIVVASQSGYSRIFKVRLFGGKH
jgi:hypothetical protein